MKNFWKNQENRISFLVFLITMIVAVSPLISRYCINGHDLEYHLLRIESLKEGILIGKPFLKVNTLFFGGAGYASSMFYSDLFMYIPALLRVCGLSIKASYHTFLVIIFVLCYAGCFYCTFKMTGSKYVATIAAVLLTLCPYHLDDMLVRAACGENMAFIFIPFVIYGIYNVLFENMSKPLVFCIGFAGLILSHPATLVLNCIFCAFVFIIFIKQFIHNPILILKVAVATVFTVAITAFFWLPMLEQMMSATFHVSNSYSDMLDAAIDFYTLFSNDLLGAGVILLVLAIPRVFLSKKEDKILQYVDVMLLAAALFAIGTTNIMPWRQLERIFNFMQFPWRMLIMTSSLLAMADAIIIVLFARKIMGAKDELAIFVVLAACIGIAIPHNVDNAQGYYDYANDYYSFIPYTANVIGGEWLPESVTDRDNVINLAQIMMSDTGDIIDFERQRAEITAHINSNTNTITVPFIYYKGYNATITGSDGSITKLRCTGEGNNGMCLVYTNGIEGTLRVWYKGTNVSVLAYVISVIAFAALVGIFVYTKKGKKPLMLFGNTIIPVFILVGITASLTGCQTEGANVGTEQIQELNEVIDEVNISDFADPEKLVNYLKEQYDEEEEVIEEEEVNYITYNVCLRGYEENGDNFAVKVDAEPENSEYTLVDIDEAKQNDALVITKSGVYSSMADTYIGNIFDIYENSDKEEKYNGDDLKRAIMTEADMLLYMEYFYDDKRCTKLQDEAEVIAKLIFNSAEEDSEDLSLMYNTSAILSKICYCMPEIENRQEYLDEAIALWNDAEKVNSDDATLDINRAWAAAELYRVTEQKTYRTIVETIADNNKLSGISFTNPGSYVAYAYLSSAKGTDYNVSSKIMNDFFDEINGKIKGTKEDLLKEAVSKKNLSEDGLSEEFINECLEDAHMAVMAEHISMSVEYVTYVKNRLMFLCGANPIGTDYLDIDNMSKYNPAIFVLFGISY